MTPKHAHGSSTRAHRAQILDLVGPDSWRVHAGELEVTPTTCSSMNSLAALFVIQRADRIQVRRRARRNPARAECYTEKNHGDGR
jgi:hypothetical protein